MARLVSIIRVAAAVVAVVLAVVVAATVTGTVATTTRAAIVVGVADKVGVGLCYGVSYFAGRHSSCRKQGAVDIATPTVIASVAVAAAVVVCRVGDVTAGLRCKT